MDAHMRYRIKRHCPVGRVIDWVIIASTRWKLRAAIRLVDETLAELKVEQHPDKTFIGRFSRGFDFLGYAFTPAGLDVAPRAVEHCVERASRLYERCVDLIRIGAYVRRWQCWAKSGLGSLGKILSAQILECVCGLLGRVGPHHWRLPPLCSAGTRPTEGDACHQCRARQQQR